MVKVYMSNPRRQSAQILGVENHQNLSISKSSSASAMSDNFRPDLLFRDSGPSVRPSCLAAEGDRIGKSVESQTKYKSYTKQDTQMRSCARNVFRLERQPLWWIHTSHFLERGGQSNKKSSGATKLTCVGTSSSTPLSTKHLISSNTTKVS